jgi:hypothetical protein
MESKERERRGHNRLGFGKSRGRKYKRHKKKEIKN